LIGFDPLKHHGLLEWFMAQPEGAVLSGYSDHLWNGVTTLQFAQLCAKLVLGDEMRRLRNESPIHHFAPNDPLSKFELLELFRRTFKKNVSINSSESPSGPARRILASRYKVLDELFGQGHSLNTALDELLGEYPERARS
jgi:dTDP-4-dehydrorhamnose reductase